MLATPVPFVPPVTKWERLAQAAARVGLPSADLLRSELSVAGSQIRAARVGKRGLLLVAANDIDAYARRLAAGVRT